MERAMAMMEALQEVRTVRVASEPERVNPLAHCTCPMERIGNRWVIDGSCPACQAYTRRRELVWRDLDMTGMRKQPEQRFQRK